jgi:lysophospholipase L1-like esterase
MALTLQRLRPFGHWVVKSYKAAAILVLNTLLVLVCFELAASSAFQIRKLFPVPPEPQVGEGGPRETLSYYRSQDWGARYWYEFRLARPMRYYPYVGWRRAPVAGKTINIDQHGIRLTPGADCSANSYKVFAFGGSTVWGTGSPDWGTITAYLQADLTKLRRGPVCVVNFGENAYVSTQDVIMLMLQLKSGNVPDVTIFYGGTDDIYAAYQSGRAGLLENLDQLAARFEGTKQPKPPTLADRLRRFASYFASYYVIEQLLGKFTIATPLQEEPAVTDLITYETMGIDVATLSDLIVRDYLANYELVTALAQQYGFHHFVFLQPLISMGNKPLTTEEQEMKDRLAKDAALDRLYTSVYQTIERESSTHSNLYYLAHIFDRYNSPLWIDEAHVTPVGNQLIAHQMVDVIERPAGIRPNK